MERNVSAEPALARAARRARELEAKVKAMARKQRYETGESHPQQSRKLIQDKQVIRALEGVLSNIRFDDASMVAHWAERLADAAYGHKIDDRDNFETS